MLEDIMLGLYDVFLQFLLQSILCTDDSAHNTEIFCTCIPLRYTEK
uniref:Uncharacterized protein n=1 Tax=Arundo donax TaxID=35708 RepID=A0A0A9FBI6_ARUDO